MKLIKEGEPIRGDFVFNSTNEQSAHTFYFIVNDYSTPYEKTDKTAIRLDSASEVFELFSKIEGLAQKVCIQKEYCNLLHAFKDYFTVNELFIIIMMKEKYENGDL